MAKISAVRRRISPKVKKGLGNDKMGEIEECLIKALDLIKESKKINIKSQENTETDIYEILKKKRDKVEISSDGVNNAPGAFEDLNPMHILKDFEDSKNELTLLRSENKELKSELVFVSTRLEDSETLIKELKDTVNVLNARNKVLRTKLEDIKVVQNDRDAKSTAGKGSRVQELLKKSMNEMEFNELDDDFRINSILSEVTDISQEKENQIPFNNTQIQRNTTCQSEEPINDADYQSQITLQSSPPAKPSPGKLKRTKSLSSMGSIDGSPLKKRLLDFSSTKLLVNQEPAKSDNVEESQENITQTPLDNNEKREDVIAKREVNSKLNLTVNPATNKPWFPEDFVMVSGYDKIDKTYGQSLEQIPVNTRIYYEHQLAFLKELATKNFNRLLNKETQATNIDSDKSLVITQLTQLDNNDARYTTPFPSIKFNLEDETIPALYKYEVNETNFNEFKKYYEDIGKTKRVKKWEIDKIPASWYVSEFPNTQEQMERNCIRDQLTYQRTLFRLYHACFMVQNCKQSGMFKFRNPIFNEAVENGQYVIDLNLFAPLN